MGGKIKGKKIINLFSFKGQISGQKLRDGRHYGHDSWGKEGPEMDFNILQYMTLDFTPFSHCA